MYELVLRVLFILFQTGVHPRSLALARSASRSAAPRLKSLVWTLNSELRTHEARHRNTPIRPWHARTSLRILQLPVYWTTAPRLPSHRCRGTKYCTLPSLWFRSYCSYFRHWQYCLFSQAKLPRLDGDQMAGRPFGPLAVIMSELLAIHMDSHC